jgi:hypothetical protein
VLLHPLSADYLLISKIHVGCEPALARRRFASDTSADACDDGAFDGFQHRRNDCTGLVTLLNIGVG